ncbi:hypothetical protein PH210_02160 [Paenibacillus sp. BSR1-1]|uniref:hypothetical protein n=1 Tax=Paenibacillus sp. BSR1-1 TaxID=3020845 RepID=UPI0025B12D25|nr:hypothetical protein [Paenibacillus sp. BSR1-1]MDN3015006.1 hypothetical protein [Paenibacillus sp. BSR1-1]
MAQKKNEAAAVEEKELPLVEDSVALGSFVNTFWDQYEQSQERAEKVRENREDAYINALKEVIKFNKQYRKTIANLYDQSKKTNKEMTTELLHQINSRKEAIKEAAVTNNDREELKAQLKEVTGQLEKLALTPFKSFIYVVDQLEHNLERSAEASVAYARERRNAWLQVRKDYVKLARNTHFNLVERGKNSFRELVKTQ